MKRKPVKHTKKNLSHFKHTANQTNPKNVKIGVQRGGIRL